MNCPNCKIETFKITTVCDDDGKPFSFCGLCPRPESKRINFPAIVTGKRGRGRPKKIENNGKFEKHKLSDEEINRNRVLSPNIRTFDTPQTRDRDSIDKMRETVFVEAPAGAISFRKRRIDKILTNKFGHSDFKIIRDNGFKVVAEALNNG